MAGHRAGKCWSRDSALQSQPPTPLCFKHELWGRSQCWEGVIPTLHTGRLRPGWLTRAQPPREGNVDQPLNQTAGPHVQLSPSPAWRQWLRRVCLVSSVPETHQCGRLSPGMFITPGASSLPGFQSILKCSDVPTAFLYTRNELFSACCQAVVKRRGK